MNQRRAISGTVALGVGHLAVTGLLLWGTAGAVSGLRGPGGPDIGAELAVAAAVGAWLLLSWLTAVTLAVVLTAVVAGIGSRAHRRALEFVPAAARRLVAALLGLTVVAAPVAAGSSAAAESLASVTAAGPIASADRSPGDPAGRAGPAIAPAAPTPLPSLDRPVAGPPPGWTPDRPAGVHRRSRTQESAVRFVASAARRGMDPVDEVIVRRGDTLWDIAARHLGPHASAADIAREWPHWYAANRSVIGTDPDLLLPGQRLVPPRP